MNSRHPAAGTTTPCGHDRRTFLKGVGLATAAGTAATAGLTPGPAEAAGTAPVFTEPAADMAPLPHVTIAGHKVPRMILGCNPIGGWAHSVPNLSKTMQQYFTPEVTYDFLQHAEKWGMNTWIG